MLRRRAGLARTLLASAAVVWLALALTAPWAVKHPRTDRTVATLLVGIAFGLAAWLAPRVPWASAALAGPLGAAVLLAIAIPDDDTRHLRQYLLAAAYRQHEHGHERYGFQPVGDWPWATFVVTAALAAAVAASVLLVLEVRIRMARRAETPSEASPS